MSKLNGKKPYKGKFYRNKKYGGTIQVLDWDDEKVYFKVVEEDYKSEIDLDIFYSKFGRIQNYVPPFRSELENK